MASEIERTQALQSLIKETIAALGEEKSKPFEIEAYFELVESPSNDYDEELCPRIRLVKK